LEIEAKAIRLAAFRGGASPEEMKAAIARIWTLETLNDPAILPR